MNSLLILAQQLNDNAEHNLTPRQVEYAGTIRSAGKDLLELIERTFRPVAESRGLTFTIEVAPTLPPFIWTDEKRLLQVVKNLLSNAFKFTEQGSVKISIAPAVSGWSVDHSELNHADAVVAFVVTDTGIGVSAGKQKLIFEAFQQADTGTSRKYGGTGLGLSISRELAHRLGGELRLIAGEITKGSIFALYVPLRTLDAQRQTPDESETVTDKVKRDLMPGPSARRLDDRESVQPGDQVLLMLQGDARLASILLEATRHIPVQIISIADDRTRGLRYGVFDYLLKPVTADEIQNALVGIVAFARRKTRSLLLVNGDEESRARLLDLLGNTFDRSQKIQLVRTGGDEGTHQHAGRGIHHRQRTAQRNEINDIAATRLTRMALKCHGPGPWDGPTRVGIF
jgi:CheY-like chemotaxis protein